LKILATDKFIAIGDLSKEEIASIKHKFTFKDMSQAMTKGGFNKRKVKTVCFARQKGQALVLKSGFLQELIFFIKEENMPVSEFQDKRTKLINIKYTDEQLKKEFNPDFDYVEHQIRALKALLKTNVGIIKAPTSAGKTEIIIALMRITNLPTLILVDSVSLAIQTAQRINEAGIPCGICHGKGKVEEFNTISTIGSYKKLGALTSYKMVIVDECHIVGASKFQEFFDITSYPYRYGFSATPAGNDKYRFATIRQHLGDVISEIYTKELIDNKVMVKPKIKFVTTECPPTPSWDVTYERCITKNKDRNDKIVKLALEQDVPTLILYKIIEHGLILGDRIPNSIVLSGTDSNSVREEAIQKFKSGEIQYLIASNIFKQGISINNIETLINASGGKSKIEVLQKIGRALRLHKGKDYALVYDFNDIGNKFTEKHSLQREDLYKKTGFTDIEILL
jgi:superfamily II DNA or RNA helicase